MWHRYAKRTMGWLCPSFSRCKEVQGQLQRDRGRTLGTMCTCEEIEWGTQACKASKLGPIERWWIRMVNWESQSKTPPQSPEEGHIHCNFTYSYCILSRVSKLATSLLVFTILWTSISVFMLKLLLWTSISVFYVKTPRDVVMVLFIFAKYITLPTHFHMHIQRHTHTSTHVQSAHKKNGDNQAQEPGWDGRKKGFVRDLAHTHTIKKNRKKNVRKKPIFTNLKKRFQHIELLAKLLDYFLRSNKSNINSIDGSSFQSPKLQLILGQSDI